MSRSVDPGHFFQTEASLETAARRAAKAGNKNGSPLTLSSKLLSIRPDPTNPSRVYVAESGGFVRRVNIETNDKSTIYKGHTVPITCLALDSKAKVLFAGSWDKTITAWDTETKEVLRTFSGHADFVKSLLYIPISAGGLLLSGSSDAAIIVWNAETGKKITTLKGHVRGVGALALDPVASTPEIAVVYSGGSEREIKRWRIPLSNPAKAEEDDEVILEHDTSVYAIRFEGEDADMWTASADNTARRIDIRSEEKMLGARSDTVLKHSDFVNDVILEPRGRWVITACRDEGIRVWDVGTGELHHTFDGHIDEVTGLAVVGRNYDTLVSISIDNTLRKWSLKPQDLKAAIELAAKEQEGGKQEEVKEMKKDKKSLMTEEEERELAELMDDSD
ncbi:hypothetical protein RUND412_008187 [Rhizina undulata]